MGLQVELSRFPLVVCSLGSAPSSEAELERDCDAYLRELGKHRGIFVCVHDWSQAAALSADSWRFVFDRVVHAAPLSSRCVAQALVVTAPSLRGFATARTLQQQSPYPVRVAASLEAALTWCSWQLKRSEPQAV